MSASPYTQMSGGYPDQFGQSGRPNAQGLNWAQQDNAQHLRQGPGGWMGPTASPGDYNLSPSMAQRAANNRWLAREQEVSNSVSRRTPSITLPPSPSGGSTGWWNASPTASAPRQGIQQFSSPTSVSQLSGRGLGLASPTQFSRSSYGTMQQRQPGLQIDTQSQGWVPSPQRSPLRLPSGSTLPLPFNVYDMKSLSVALATVQAGTGQIAAVFQSCSFKPRLPGLTKLVSQLTREGNWQKGLEVFECLSVLGVVPDTTITNAAISACDRGGQWEKALAIFNAMDEAGLPRDAITYSALISALSKGRQWSLAIDVFNHMSDAGIECDAVTCCSLITALDKGGQWQLAEQVFIQMYADHPQFRMLLQCMTEEPDGPTNAGAAAAAQPDMPLTHAAWDPAAEGELAATLAAAARLIGAGHQIPGLLEGSTLAALSGGLGPGASGPWSTSGVTGQDKVVGAPMNTQQLPVANRSSSLIGSMPTPIPGANGHTPMSGALLPSESAPSSSGPTSPGTPAPAGASLRKDGDAGVKLQPLDVAQIMQNIGALDSDSAKTPPEMPSPSSAPTHTDTQAHLARLAASLSGANTPPMMSETAGVTHTNTGVGVGAGATAASPLGDMDLVTNMMGGLFRQAGSVSVPGTPPGALSSMASGSTNTAWSDIQARMAGETTSPPQLGAANTIGMGSSLHHHLQAGTAGGGGGLLSPNRFQAAVPGNAHLSPMQRGGPGSGPPPRGLLRTSSLNIKKAAPNRVCCNALLAAYARAVPTQWQRALRLLDLMWQCGGEMQPDIVSYNTVIKAAGNAQQVALGFQVYQLMCSRGIEPTVATYGTLICIAADVGATALVKEAWRWLRNSGLEVHVTAANAYLSALIKEGEWSEARALLNAMMSSGGPCRPNAVTFSVMSAAYLTRGEPGAIKQLYQHMCAAGVQPSPNTLAQLGCVLATKGMWEDAIAILAAICRQESGSGLRPIPGVFAHALCALSDAAWDALSSGDMNTRKELSVRVAEVCTLLQGHVGAALSSDVSLCRAMVGALAAVGDADACVDVFNGMMVSGTPVDEDLSAAVLGSLCEQRRWERLAQLVGLLAQHGQPPGSCLSPQGLVQVMTALEAAGAWVYAYQVLKAVCGGNKATWLSVVESIKTNNAADLLLLALLVDKDMTGAWTDALCLFMWQHDLHKDSRFLQSEESYWLLVEMLYTHGGSEGLQQAVQLVKTGHERGVLQSYTRPGAAKRRLLAAAVPGGIVEAPAGAADSVGEAVKSSGDGDRVNTSSTGTSSARGSAGSPEEDEEEAQLRGERTASLVAHAALDTHGDIDITTHTSNTTGNGTSTPASLMLPSDSTKGVMGTNGHAKGVGSAMGQGGPGAGAAGGSASRVSVGGQATPTGGPSSRVASRGATPPALQRPLGVAEAPLGMEDTAADMNNTDGEGQLEDGSWVILSGPTTVHALVNLLAWASTLTDAARDDHMLVKRQCADILITIPFTDMEAAEQMLGLVNRALPQGSSSRPSLSQFRHIVSAVLEGSYVSLLTNRACKIELTPEQQRVFVLQPPGVMYWPDPVNPGLVHVNMQSFYQAVLPRPAGP